MLTQQRLHALLDYDPETGIFRWKVKTSSRAMPGQIAGTWHNRGYRKIQVDGIPVLSHRLAWLYVYGDIPANEIDHINGVTSDNRIVNLRQANRADNCRNRISGLNNNSGILGVSWYAQTRRWRARISINGKEKSLGYFKSKADAVAARKAAVAKHYGAFVREA